MHAQCMLRTAEVQAELRGLQQLLSLRPPLRLGAAGAAAKPAGGGVAQRPRLPTARQVLDSAKRQAARAGHLVVLPRWAAMPSGCVRACVCVCMCVTARGCVDALSAWLPIIVGGCAVCLL